MVGARPRPDGADGLDERQPLPGPEGARGLVEALRARRREGALGGRDRLRHRGGVGRELLAPATLREQRQAHPRDPGPVGDERLRRGPGLPEVVEAAVRRVIERDHQEVGEARAAVVHGLLGLEERGLRGAEEQDVALGGDRRVEGGRERRRVDRLDGQRLALGDVALAVDPLDLACPPPTRDLHEVGEATDVERTSRGARALLEHHGSRDVHDEHEHLDGVVLGPQRDRGDVPVARDRRAPLVGPRERGGHGLHRLVEERERRPPAVEVARRAPAPEPGHRVHGAALGLGQPRLVRPRPRALGEGEPPPRRSRSSKPGCARSRSRAAGGGPPAWRSCGSPRRGRGTTGVDRGRAGPSGRRRPTSGPAAQASARASARGPGNPGKSRSTRGPHSAARAGPGSRATPVPKLGFAATRS